LGIERKLDRLTKEKEQQIMADIFDRIIAGIAALQAGDTAALQQHVAAIDSHLSNVDDELLGLQTSDTSEKSRLDAIEQGLGKVADAVSPPAAAGGSGTGSGSDTGGAPADGSGSGDVGPGDGPAPAAGPGSETTGQVDTPVTQ
jgi:hypothetical protein